MSVRMSIRLSIRMSTPISAHMSPAMSPYPCPYPCLHTCVYTCPYACLYPCPYTHVLHMSTRNLVHMSRHIPIPHVHQTGGLVGHCMSPARQRRSFWKCCQKPSCQVDTTAHRVHAPCTCLSTCPRSCLYTCLHTCLYACLHTCLSMDLPCMSIYMPHMSAAWVFRQRQHSYLPTR